MADESSDSTEETRILRRAPLNTGSQPVLSGPETSSESPTSLLRRHPTGELAAASVSAPVTQHIPRAKPRAQPIAVGAPRVPRADSRAAQATAVAAIVSGWASGVIATDLIAGWWATDPLFCVAIGFLAAVSAAGSISGVIALLLRRPNARLLIVVGAVIAILIFASLFVAGAKLPALVYAMPLLPLASIVLAALPATARWSRSG